MAVGEQLALQLGPACGAGGGGDGFQVRLLRRAAGKADEVIVLAYGGRTVDIWWQKESATLSRLQNLKIHSLSVESSRALAGLAERSMELGCTIQDGEIWFSAGEKTLSIIPETIFSN